MLGISGTWGSVCRFSTLTREHAFSDKCLPLCSPSQSICYLMSAPMIELWKFIESSAAWDEKCSDIGNAMWSRRTRMLISE